MTVQELIFQVDIQLYNTIPLEQKLTWLNQLESRIYWDVLNTHEPGPKNPFVPLTVDSKLNVELLAGDAFDDMYLWYMVAMINLFRGEIVLYNNAASVYHEMYEEFARWYNRSHMPKSQRWKL